MVGRSTHRLVLLALRAPPVLLALLALQVPPDPVDLQAARASLALLVYQGLPV